MKIRYKKTGCCEGSKEPSPASPCCAPEPSAKLKKTAPAQPCCAPEPPAVAPESKTSCCAPHSAGRPASFTTVSDELTFNDRLRHIRCRLGAFRMVYKVKPGLYAVGRPSGASDVFVSANYGLSFDILRSSLAGMDAWIIVLDTKGINVWCAAGKGTFGTDGLVRQIKETGLGGIVTHRRVIVPQLGGPGISGHEVKRATGFKVVYGPVRASDIKAFVDAGYRATEEMRTVMFGLRERLILTPMEIRPAMKAYALFCLIALVISSITPEGISYQAALTSGGRLVLLGGLSVLSGALITPALLPFIPSRSFAIKGFIAGIATTASALLFTGWASVIAPLLTVFAMIFFPLASSYLALQFTGSSTYTGISGVKKELRYGVPVYITGAGLSLLAVAAYKLSEWGII